MKLFYTNRKRKTRAFIFVDKILKKIFLKRNKNKVQIIDIFSRPLIEIQLDFYVLISFFYWYFFSNFWSVFVLWILFFNLFIVEIVNWRSQFMVMVTRTSVEINNLLIIKILRCCDWIIPSFIIIVHHYRAERNAIESERNIKEFADTQHRYTHINGSKIQSQHQKSKDRMKKKIVHQIGKI